MTRPNPASQPMLPRYADSACRVTAPVVFHEQIADRTWRLRVECPSIATSATPGQFAMVRIPDRHDPLLARPLAIYDTFCSADGRDADGFGTAANADRYVDFIYAVHGRFTSALRGIPAGQDLIVWGPLGNGFQIPPVDHLVLVAGGIGQTALLALGRERLGNKRYGPPSRPRIPSGRVTCCWGARHAGLFGGLDDFVRAGIDVRQATLDGSVGLRGTVVDLLDAVFGPAEATPRARIGAPTDLHVACCGPDPMMAAVGRWSADRHVACSVSLEAPMACGVGICFTCVARVRDDTGSWDYRRTCVEGPVFDARRIEW